MNAMDKKRNKLLIDKVKSMEQDTLGVVTRQLSVCGVSIYILYVQQLTDRDMLCESVIKPVVNCINPKFLDISSLASTVIYADDVVIDDKIDKIVDYVLGGKTVVISSIDDKYMIINLLQIEKRTTSTPEIEYTIRGARDAFTENFDSNMSLIRYRLKDPGLRIERFSLGRRTKTNIAMLYIDEIVNQKLLSNIREKLNSMDIDEVLESGVISKYIEDNDKNLFPQVCIAERPDTVTASIIEGRIAIVVEGSNFALIAPRTFVEFLDSPDDHYQKSLIGIFSKFIRVFCILITLTLSSLYVAVVGFHSDILPAPYIIAIATSRSTVPFNALLEATLMEGVAEILREASLRLPKQIGSAIGIVGTIVIGQAAVSAGLVSPLMVIIVALTTLCSFVAPDFTIMNPIRLLKFFMIFITGIFGLFGFAIGYTFIVIGILSLSTTGIPYVSPIAPFNLNDFKNYIYSNIMMAKRRPEALKTYDNTRKKDNDTD